MLGCPPRLHSVGNVLRPTAASPRWLCPLLFLLHSACGGRRAPAATTGPSLEVPARGRGQSRPASVPAVASGDAGGVNAAAPVALPDGLQAVARSDRPLLTFSQPGGMLIIRRGENTYRFGQPLSIARVVDGVCGVLGGADTLPSGIGAVDLDRDACRRWGFLPGVTEHKAAFRNVGSRRITGAGIVHGSPWLVLTTEPSGEAPPIAISDLHAWTNEHWNLEWSSRSTRTRSLTWEVAVSCPGIDSIAGLELTRRELGVRSSYGWAVQWLNQGKQVRSSPLASSSREQWLEPEEMMCGDAGEVVVAGEAGHGAFALWRVARERPAGSAMVFDDVRPPRVGPGPFAGVPERRAHWGVRFLSSNELILWRLGAPRFRFNYDAAARSWRRREEPDATPEERAIEAASRDPAQHVIDVQSTTDGQLWLVLARGSQWFVASNVPVSQPCVFDDDKVR